jgi:hypothetical protein
VGWLATSVTRELAVLVLVGYAALVFGLSGYDIVVLVRVARDARRLKRGLPPEHPGIDYGIGSDEWLQVVPAESPYRAQDRRDLMARGSPATAARALARDLLGRVVVCGFAYLLLLAGMERPVFVPEPLSGARSEVSALRAATLLYVNTHPGGCPSVGTLLHEGFLDRTFPGQDPWGSPWELHCDGDEVHVTSLGPDRWVGTSDDIVIPPPDVR